ncbi:sulfate adenylyltransferase subunit 1 [Dinghuibacter silviterrae]|uniref:sulfate adenylyltransferase n=1 Tax=Dinghuibacter silviterrae TaxID=1539049 RepID=A0A4R8DMT6_9BACT|nr:GTP-binding protein [Dinghuibacter silviterrae]TDW99309.1 sulfate adenylyltransferase subunit 1 [Dinghuibacter silviterrae]
MEVLRIATAGSVDDGKSTLIGRLLYDTRSIADDRLEAISQASKRKGLDFTDLSLLTDGLIAEREQGITIDVAHIYFSTPTRKYIIADTPGHVEYTRNMITGASNAQASIVLIDARNGVVEQTRRHLYIASLLRMKDVIVCVNKMDLVSFETSAFNAIRVEVLGLADQLGIDRSTLHFIPVAAKGGDNVVTAGSDNMPWYKGPSLLALLESLQPGKGLTDLPLRFPVQYVIRPHQDAFHDFRGYAGKIASGSWSVGDSVVVLPSARTATISGLFKGTEAVSSASAGESITVTLAEDVDVSRGNMLVRQDQGGYPEVSNFTARIAWMDEHEMKEGKTFLLQHAQQVVKVKVLGVEEVLDIHTFQRAEEKKSFHLNDIGTIRLKSAKPLFLDRYADNPANGAFILIDEFSNNTVAVGFVS